MLTEWEELEEQGGRQGTSEEAVAGVQVNVGMMIWGEVNVTNGTSTVSVKGIQPVCEPDEWSGWKGEAGVGGGGVVQSEAS